MSVSLVTITHPVDPTAEIPFVGGRAPLQRIAVETWKVRHIAAMGFDVEVHEEPYDPLAKANAEAAKLAEALAAGTPIQEEPTVEEAAPVADLEPTPVEQPETPAPQEQAPAEETSEEGSEQEQSEEEGGLTEEEIAALRARVEALTTKADAEALIAEYGIQMDPMPSKLKDIKAQLLAMIDGE